MEVNLWNVSNVKGALGPVRSCHDAKVCCSPEMQVALGGTQEEAGSMGTCSFQIQKPCSCGKLEGKMANDLVRVKCP